ncbi:PLP-dependent aminotransferase family protein [Sandaracinus amylolyticus]|uniref:aminotransferase-like domain-containing protein n=1 Tax=Sandaracinus amylolyticus TaxID=927083 RepID=UPI001F2762A5|nr:PLP-dependent aminotransferase family protein [Sandaracinus amylolyticus]UJR83136.1 Hypothetical protein I5071_52020 [Sandaracinus amylolyticus]
MGRAKEDAFLYEKIADELGEMIARGALRPGERLPSVRRMSEERGVSVATVVAAYQLLEHRGAAEPRPKSGHFVRARAGADTPVPTTARRAPAPTRVSIHADADDLIQVMLQARRGQVPLGCAYVATELLPLRKLNAILAQVAREGGGPGGEYADLRGSLQLRRQLARRAVRWGVALEPDELVTTLGATDALNLALASVTRPGDVIALESPTYFAFMRMLEHHGLRAIEIPTDPQTGLDLDALDDALRRAPVRAVLCSPNFQNPLGARMPDEQKERLVKMVARRGVALIEDDVYGDLAHDGSRPRAAKSFDRDGSVLLVGSMSKTLAPGYRVGWLAPGRWDEAVVRKKSAMTLACPTPTEMAVAELLDEGGYDRHLRRLRRAIADQCARYREAIARSFPEGTRVSRPQGGFVLWVELPQGTSGIALQAEALERGIAIAPGPIFSARQRFQSCIRISTGFPFSPRIERAIATLGKIAEELAPKRAA